ncbi:MAG TPA: hypothetical protein VG672_07135 [Bryobacteraceae bacterium]|jgi:hypothetical protein|nr:hypothetical protein [Bryobacteraceae bacterium]
MSDRALLFVFSIVMVVASLGAAGWLLATGQAASVDGLFLLLASLLLGLSFSLYLVFLVRRVMASMAPPAASKAQAASAATQKPAEAVR